jgi:hypothetical protein
VNFKNITDDMLVAQTETEIRRERQSTLKIIKLFQEIYDRKIYLERGYSSFYEMATKHFGYCAGSAMRRISAMKLVREMPQFESKIESGELSLSVAADVQSFLYHESKIERPYSLSDKIELVETCLGKSRREVESEFAKRNPEREKRESAHAISQDRLRVSFTISKALHDKLNHLKDLLSHVDPNMTTESLIECLAELGLNKHDPARRAARARARRTNRSGNTESTEPTSESSPVEFTSAAEVKRTRYVIALERHNVMDDGGGCTFVSTATGRRCESRKFLQLDHIEPFAHGGENTAKNLRWMCAQHNRFRNGFVPYRR